MNLLIKTSCVILSCLTVAACTPNISASNYQVDTIGRAQTIRYGKIMQVNVVQVASDSGVGTLAGAAAGATAGSFIGGNSRVNLLGGIGGAVLGGLAGSAIEGKSSGQQALQYIVKLENGQSLSVVQGLDNPLRVGQRVMVLSGTGASDRVVADTSR